MGRQYANALVHISIHVLRVEDDVLRDGRNGHSCISIHVLRVEDDHPCAPRTEQPAYFNPRPPCGGRRIPRKGTTNKEVFQSTSSVWRTTAPATARCSSAPFQSTSSVWRTTHLDGILSRYMKFQSTSSVWRTTVQNALGYTKLTISIHVLRVEDDHYTPR